MSRLTSVTPAWLALAALALAPPDARADTVSLTVTGTIRAGTCTMAVSPVALDEIRVSELANATPVGFKDANVTFSNCVGVRSINLSFSGNDDSAQDGHWKNNASGGAGGVAVALRKGNSGTTYRKKGATDTITPNGATARYDMQAGYFAKTAGSATPGAVQASVTIVADYQ